MDYRSGKCSQCGAEYKVPASFAHNVARCKVCKGVVHLGPAASARSEPRGEQTERPQRPRVEPKPAAPRPARPPVPEAPRQPAPSRATVEARDAAPAAEPAAPAAAEPHAPAAPEPALPAAAQRAERAKALPIGAALCAAGLVALVLLFVFRERLFSGEAPAGAGPDAKPSAAAQEPGAAASSDAPASGADGSK